jgi:tRNA U34 5-carboxymethylaminomethyl modifying GTPase MnmE/TrmE
MTTTRHIVHGKLTIHGHIVHYTDPAGANTHAALITNIYTHPSTGDHHADLVVFPQTTGDVQTVKGVPHDRDGGPHTWKHLPY